MPLLHIGLTENRSDVKIDSELVAQNLTLIRASCTYKHTTANVLEAIAVDLPFISPLDYISNDSSRHIILPFNFGEHGAGGDTKTQSILCNFQFDIEHIPKTFSVNCFSIKTGTDGFVDSTFSSANGAIQRVDLYFHYETIHRKF